VTQRPCILTVHAHPDDESSKGPATIARYAAQGVHTVLVCCTGGEEGEILNPAVVLEDGEELGSRRARELEDAARIIGYDEVVMLGYRDSGMPDSEANARPEAFANAPLDEAVIAGTRRGIQVRAQCRIQLPDLMGQTATAGIHGWGIGGLLGQEQHRGNLGAHQVEIIQG